MKIFFLVPRIKSLYPNFERITSHLKDSGHTVFDQWMSVSEEDARQNFEETYKQNLNWIKNCDIVISEITEASRGVNFLLALALEHKKPILALYSSENKKSMPSSTIMGSARYNKLLTYKEYNDDVEKILNEFLNKVKKIIDTKFILIISPAIDRYLTWAVENKRMHKAQIVREAVEEMITKDKDYKQYLAKQD